MITKLRPIFLAAILIAFFAASSAHGQAFQVNKHLYSETANPTADIAAARVQALRDKKNILLDFGGNWCGDCQVLDFYYHQSPNAELLSKNYVVVHIDIGHMDHNVDIAQKYNVPITHGVPALAILDAHGKLLYAEREKEFERSSPEAIHAFLDHWKPSASSAAPKPGKS